MIEIDKDIEICELRALVCGIFADLEKTIEILDSYVKEYRTIKHHRED